MTAHPETLRQARRWDECAARYRRALGCAGCSAQAAWGRALGWLQVRPPCQGCRPIVQTWAGALVNGWHTGEPVSLVQMTANAVPVYSDLAEPRRSLAGKGVAA